MFTGIVQGIARVDQITDKPGLRSFLLRFPDGFCRELAVGASVAVDGTCLTVTEVLPGETARFDVMQQSLGLTTLAGLHEGSPVNVERAARDGAEIGGHPLSGHIDFMARIGQIRRPENNCVLRFSVPAPWMRYVFAKGYIAVNGAILTVAEAGREAGLPEDLAMRLARATVAGAGELLHRAAESAGQLRRNVTSPNGTTAAALEVLMAPDGLQPLMSRAVAAAARRSRELAG